MVVLGYKYCFVIPGMDRVEAINKGEVSSVR